jgi:hypothetical protein
MFTLLSARDRSVFVCRQRALLSTFVSVVRKFMPLQTTNFRFVEKADSDEDDEVLPSESSSSSDDDAPADDSGARGLVMSANRSDGAWIPL